MLLGFVWVRPVCVTKLMLTRECRRRNVLGHLLLGAVLACGARSVDETGSTSADDAHVDGGLAVSPQPESASASSSTDIGLAPGSSSLWPDAEALQSALPYGKFVRPEWQPHDTLLQQSLWVYEPCVGENERLTVLAFRNAEQMYFTSRAHDAPNSDPFSSARSLGLTVAGNPNCELVIVNWAYNAPSNRPALQSIWRYLHVRREDPGIESATDQGAVDWSSTPRAARLVVLGDRAYRSDNFSYHPACDGLGARAGARLCNFDATSGDGQSCQSPAWNGYLWARLVASDDSPRVLYGQPVVYSASVGLDGSFGSSEPIFDPPTLDPRALQCDAAHCAVFGTEWASPLAERRVRYGWWSWARGEVDAVVTRLVTPWLPAPNNLVVQSEWSNAGGLAIAESSSDEPALDVVPGTMTSFIRYTQSDADAKTVGAQEVGSAPFGVETLFGWGESDPERYLAFGAGVVANDGGESRIATRVVGLNADGTVTTEHLLDMSGAVSGCGADSTRFAIADDSALKLLSVDIDGAVSVDEQPLARWPVEMGARGAQRCVDDHFYRVLRHADYLLLERTALATEAVERWVIACKPWVKEAPSDPTVAGTLESPYFISSARAEGGIVVVTNGSCSGGGLEAIAVPDEGEPWLQPLAVPTLGKPSGSAIAPSVFANEEVVLAWTPVRSGSTFATFWRPSTSQ